MNVKIQRALYIPFSILFPGLKKNHDFLNKNQKSDLFDLNRFLLFKSIFGVNI